MNSSVKGIIFGIIISIIVGLVIFNKCSNNTTEYITTTDTIYIEKILIDSIPKEVDRYIIKHRTDTFVITKIINDSIVSDSVVIDIPIEQVEYNNKITKDSVTIDYNAYVSGYKPSLDSIKFNIKYPEIHNTDIIIPKKKWQDNINFSVGTMAGYGIFTNKPDIFIGAGITYNF